MICYSARKMVTGPASEPLSLAEAKAHLLVEDDDQEPLISSLIVTARRSIEHEIGRALMPQTWDVWFEGFPRCDLMALPLGTLRSLSAFEWTDSGGTVRSWTPSGSPTNTLTQSSVTRAHVATEGEPGEIKLAYNQDWPQDTLKTSNPIRVRGEWGYSTIPAEIVHAMKLLVGHYFSNREAVVVGVKSSVDTRPLIRGVQSLIFPYKIRF